tara:strand:- start:1268 stop:2251 length:984 start_codon:yes stop_codon:yes gene_type:complete
MSKKVWNFKGNQWGFFSLFLELLDGLRWCEKNDYVPHIEGVKNEHYHSSTGFNGSNEIWEYYFEPIKTQINDGDNVREHYNEFLLMEIPQNFGFRSAGSFGRRWMKGRVDEWPLVMDDDGWWREEANRVINKFGIKPNSIVQEKINNFIDDKMSAKVKIGVHIRAGRGMKGTYHTDNIKLENYRDLTLKKIEKLGHDDYVVFVASDSNVAVNFMKDNVPNVVSYDCSRTNDYYQNGKSSNDVVEVGWNQNLQFEPNNRAKVGEEAVIECYLLSNCNMMIHWESGLAVSASYINPTLKLLPIDIFLKTDTYYKNRIEGCYEKNFEGII